MKYDFYDAIALGDHEEDNSMVYVEKVVAVDGKTQENSYSNRLQRDFMSKLLVFLLGITLGVIVNLGAYQYFISGPTANIPVGELDRPQAIAVAIKEAWGIDSPTEAMKLRKGMHPLYLGIPVDEKEKDAIQKALPGFNFTFISSWDELPPLLEQYKGNTQSVVTTVVGEVNLGQTSRTVSVGLRSGKDMYATITYELKRENLVWRVSSSVGDLKLL